MADVTALPAAPISASTESALAQVALYPRLRFMGSKYRLAPHLAAVFAEIGGDTALDAFSGSGVVSYLLKAMGYRVTTNDFMAFPGVIANATIANSATRLSRSDIDRICGPAVDDRRFVQTTFDGLYFTTEDRAFVDSAWSHIARMSGGKRSLALASLILSAARRQPRGVFTFTDASKYADGRRDLTLTLEEHFRERAADYNAAVFSNGKRHRVLTGDVFDVAVTGHDVVYLDPPYAPPRDDADYMKRYHFLEGLSVYWEGQEIMQHTRTKKIAKRYTPFAYKRSIADAMRRTFRRFADSTLVLSYSSNALPDRDTIVSLLREVKTDVEVIPVPHTYSFGTHARAARTRVDEYIFVAR